MKKHINVLGILGLVRDPAACLVRGGKIIAVAEEERFVRIKHARGLFPKNAIKFCLDYGKIAVKDIDFIAIAWDTKKYPGRMAEIYLENWYKYKITDEKTLQWHIKMLRDYDHNKYEQRIVDELVECGFDKDDMPPIKFVEHHYSHAVSAYYCSGFKEASVITIDGHGEENCTVLWEVRNKTFKKVKEFNIPNSMGWFYAAFTKFAGFEIYDGEGKLMGLAPYGKPNKKIMENVNKLCKTTNDGYEIDPSYLFYYKRTYADEYSDKFVEVFGKGRNKDEFITEYHKNVAYEAQNKLEETGLNLAKYIVEKTGIKNLCLAGGVALNCKMNGHIWKNLELNNIFIQPMSSDEGAALGAAIAVSIEAGYDVENLIMHHVYFGPEYTNEEIKKALDIANVKYQYIEEVEKETSKLIADGKIIGWFQGRMEVGPRALGNRSILADPRRSETKDIVNNKVKFRESWRPFCPSILDECKEDYLEKAYYHPFMILTFFVKEGKKNEIPAVVHVDGTTRPQTIKKDVNPRYWKLIDEFRKLTNVPVLLNTSFNIRGEPIVCNPQDAINCFLKTGIDVLVLGNYIIKK